MQRNDLVPSFLRAAAFESHFCPEIRRNVGFFLSRKLTAVWALFSLTKHASSKRLVMKLMRNLIQISMKITAKLFEEEPMRKSVELSDSYIVE